MSEKFEEPIGRKFEFPTALLSSISECSPEGFLLFYIDNSGTPQVRAAFNHDITEIGLRSYATKFLNSINQVEQGEITNSLFEDGLGDDFDEEDLED